MRMCDGDIPHEICSSKVFLGFCALLNRLIRSAVMRIPVCGLNVLLYGCVHNFFLFFFLRALSLFPIKSWYHFLIPNWMDAE